MIGARTVGISLLDVGGDGKRRKHAKNSHCTGIINYTRSRSQIKLAKVILKYLINYTSGQERSWLTDRSRRYHGPNPSNTKSKCKVNLDVMSRFHQKHGHMSRSGKSVYTVPLLASNRTYFVVARDYYSRMSTTTKSFSA